MFFFYHSFPLLSWIRLGIVLESFRNCLRLNVELSLNIPEIIWESSWNHIRIILESSWNYLGILLESSWNRLRIVQESSWNCLGIIFKSFFNHLGIILESFKNHIGIMLESFWYHVQEESRLGKAQPAARRAQIKAADRPPFFQSFIFYKITQPLSPLTLL